MTQPKNSRLAVLLDKNRKEGKPFFVVPGLGGHVLSFQLLGRHFSKQWMGYGVLHPVFIKEDYDTIEAVAERMLRDIRIVQERGPYFLAGYSMGGIICLEIARLLLEQNEKVKLVLLDVRIFELAPLKSLIKRLPIFLVGKTCSIIARYKRNKAQLLRNNLIDLNKGGNLGKSMPPLVKRAFESGRKQVSAYKQKTCDVKTVLVKSEDVAWWDNLRNWLPDYGWSRYVNLLGVVSAPGDHLDMIRQKENNAALAAAIENAFQILETSGATNECDQNKNT